MVLEANSKFCLINKHVINFLKSSGANDDMITQWKEKNNQSKLKTLVKKSKTSLPRRVVSKYLYFCQDERIKVKQENPGMDIQKITCELGKRWKEFQVNPEPVRMAKITALFEADKLRYDTAKQECEKSEPKKKKKVPNSAYMAFCTSERSKDQKITMKQLGEKWAKVKESPGDYEKYRSMVKA